MTVTPGDVGQPYAINASGPVYDAARAAFRQAWGVEPIDMGMGGSIPFIAEFAAAFPKAAILVTGVERSRDAGAQHQREPAPGCAGAGRDRRGAAAGQPRLNGEIAVQLGHVPGGVDVVLGRGQFRIEKDVQLSNLARTNNDNIEPGVFGRLAFRARAPSKNSPVV